VPSEQGYSAPQYESLTAGESRPLENAAITIDPPEVESAAVGHTTLACQPALETWCMYLRPGWRVLRPMSSVMHALAMVSSGMGTGRLYQRLKQHDAAHVNDRNSIIFCRLAQPQVSQSSTRLSPESQLRA